MLEGFPQKHNQTYIALLSCFFDKVQLLRCLCRPTVDLLYLLFDGVDVRQQLLILLLVGQQPVQLRRQQILMPVFQLLQHYLALDVDARLLSSQPFQLFVQPVGVYIELLQGLLQPLLLCLAAVVLHLQPVLNWPGQFHNPFALLQQI